MKAHAVLLFVAPLLFAAPLQAAPLAMEDLVVRALSQSPTLQGAAFSLRAQEARVGVARAPYLPQVSASAGLSETTNVSNTQTVAQPFSLGNTSLSVRQTLLNFGKIGASVDQAEYQAEAARQQAALAAVEVAHGVRQAYMAWAQAAGLESQAGEQVRFSEVTLAEARARFKAGVSAQLDVTRAETALAQAKASLLGSHVATAQAQRTLAAAVGQSAPLAGEPAFPAPSVSRPRPDDEATVSEHPSYRLARAQLLQAEAAAFGAERAGWPDLNADASYGLRARDFQGAQNWQAGVNLNWPLFTGFSVESQQQAASMQAAALRASLAGRRLEILRDVDNARLAVAGARERVPAAQVALASARANLAQARGRYRAGVGSILEVADAQALLASAQADGVRATTSYHLAQADLLRAMGLIGSRP